LVERTLTSSPLSRLIRNVAYYKDVNGEWTAEFGGLVYLDFVPRTGCNNTVEYRVEECK